MTIDPFKEHSRSLTSPATRHFEINPADGVNLDIRPRALRVTSSGDLAVRDFKNNVVVYPVNAGETLLFSAIGIEATGTTASVVGWL